MTDTEDLAGQIWAAMCQDDKKMAATYPDETRRTRIRAIVEQLPGILIEVLDAPVGIENILRARRAYLRHLLQDDNLIVLTFDGASPIKDALTDMVHALVEGQIESIEHILNDVSGWIREQDTSEEFLLRLPTGGKLNATNMRRWHNEDAGTFTIRDLLVSQPWAILNQT